MYIYIMLVLSIIVSGISIYQKIIAQKELESFKKKCGITNGEKLYHISKVFTVGNFIDAFGKDTTKWNEAEFVIVYEKTENRGFYHEIYNKKNLPKNISLGDQISIVKNISRFKK